jgi:hypothetical protein
VADDNCVFCVSDKFTNSTSSSLSSLDIDDSVYFSSESLFSTSLFAESTVLVSDSSSSADFDFLDFTTALNGSRVLVPLEISTEYSPAVNFVFPIGTDPLGFN